MIRRPPRSTQSRSSAASDVYKRQYQRRVRGPGSELCRAQSITLLCPGGKIVLRKSIIKAIPLALAGVIAVAAAAEARDQIRIVGSSTVFPFSTTVAETFGKTSGFKTPVVESTGSGGGLKLFCSGVGVQHPDITNASRRIKSSEVELCAKNGVSDIVEVKLGFDGIVIGNSKGGPAFNLTKQQIFLALAAEVPVDGKIVKNPYSALIPVSYTHLTLPTIYSV
eukprot:TRINITY_DN101_c0_g1_i11.p1 TRINITY_DN101_c0_g1~~TRINITY_DN101_c0_g1_i11.p1  ORF type:complete len:223 (+),score=81.87 TRINITY_DN101_c0_g1_i11:106-774(+)